jgi:AraC-like DNA-binding protein
MSSGSPPRPCPSGSSFASMPTARYGRAGCPWFIRYRRAHFPSWNSFWAIARVVYQDGAPEKISPRAVLISPQTHRYASLKFQGAVQCFVVLFQPAGLHRFFSVPMQDLTDRAYDGHSVLGSFVSRLEQRLGECASFSERVRAADAYFLLSAKAPRSSERISAAAAELVSASGNARVSAIAAASGLCVRQFERGFQERLGLSPKLFARIVRFEAALDRKARSPIRSWTDIASELGYFDQMHMIHDFHTFTGGTPTRILAEMESLFRERIKAIRVKPTPIVAGADLDMIL